MKITGKLRIEWIDSRSGELIRFQEQGNLIPDKTLTDNLSWGTNNIFSAAKISISTQNTAPTGLNSTLTQIIATGYIATGITSPIYYPDASPPYFEIINRIDNISIARTFYTVGLTNQASGNSQNNLSDTTLAYLLLAIPCTQGEFEILNLYYRIEITGNPTNGLNAQSKIDFGRALMTPSNQEICSFHALYSNYTKLPTASYLALSINPNNTGRVGFRTLNGAITGWTSGTAVNNHFKWRMVLSRSYNYAVGQVLNALLIGVNFAGFSSYGCKQFNGKSTPIQNAFTKLATATDPFFNAANQGSSKGKETLSEVTTGSWGDRFPEFYQFIIGTGGTVGTATYKFRKRNFIQFNGNSFTQVVSHCPFRNINELPFVGAHGWRKENNDILRFSDTQIVQYDDTGVTFLNPVTGDYINWNSTTTPSLAVSQARQCATNGSKIWVACRNTGLWEIDPIANTINYLVAMPCFGVDWGNGKAWAIFNGSLRNSDNWAVSATFSYAGISDSNWARVNFIKCDPSHANHRIGIVTNNAADTNRFICWWDAAIVGGAGITGQSSSLRKWPACFDVSDTGGFWARSGASLTYGSTAETGLSAIGSDTFTHSIYGSDAYHKVTFFGEYLITGTNGLRTNTNVLMAGSVGASVSSSYATMLHLVGGIVLGSNWLHQIDSLVWEDYGWDGANWILNNANFKPTHLTDAPLINGLQIKWSNGTTTPHFSAGELINQGVCHGLLKDTATTLYYEGAWYSKGVAEVDLTAQTIPASAPYTLSCLPCTADVNYLRFETDSPKLQAFKINGVAITTLYVNGEVPGPNEVTLNGSTGILTFNATDAGKTFSGRGCYLFN